MVKYNDNKGYNLMNMADTDTSCTLVTILTITMITFNNNNNMADTVTSCTEREALSAMETLGAIRPCLPASVSQDNDIDDNGNNDDVDDDDDNMDNNNIDDNHNDNILQRPLLEP